MREIDWVSPLLPDRTDIANYTQRAGAALSNVASLNTIHDQQATDSRAYRFGEFPPFFNIGNDVRFHGGTLEAALSAGGIIVAHDHLVQNLLVGTLKANSQHWAHQYRHLMSMAYGRPGLEAACDFEAGQMTLPEMTSAFSGLEVVASKALFVITHNPLLAKSISDSTGLYCFTLPLPIVVPPERRPGRTPAGTFEILVFGYIGENRSVETLLDIIRQDESRTLRLTIAGTIGSSALQRTVDTMVADGYDIHLTGFLDDQDLDRLINEADLVANIRSPSMGEVSGSQLRVFANSGLSVVADQQWYATLPTDAVFKIDPLNITRELMSVIESVRDSTDRVQAMRASGYRFVRDNHDPRQYRSAFETMLDGCGEALRHGIGLRMATHSADLYGRVAAGAFADVDRILRNTQRLSGWMS